MAIWAIRGPVGSAKSTFANSFPGKKMWFDLERGAHRAWGFDGGDSTIWQPETKLDVQNLRQNLLFSRGDRIMGRRKSWEDITSKYFEVIVGNEYSVIIFDTAKEAWTINHQSSLEEKQDQQEEDAKRQGKEVDRWRQNLQPIEYATPNSRMDSLITIARAAGKHLVLLNHERDIYGPRMTADGRVLTNPDGSPQMEPTGEKELDGYRHTLDLADWVLATRQVLVGGEVQRFEATILKSPVGADLVGKSLPNPSYEVLTKYVEAMGRKAPGL